MTVESLSTGIVLGISHIAMRPLTPPTVMSSPHVEKAGAQMSLSASGSSRQARNSPCLLHSIILSLLLDAMVDPSGDRKRESTLVAWEGAGVTCAEYIRNVWFSGLSDSWSPHDVMNSPLGL